MIFTLSKKKSRVYQHGVAYRADAPLQSVWYDPFRIVMQIPRSLSFDHFLAWRGRVCSAMRRPKWWVMLATVLFLVSAMMYGDQAFAQTARRVNEISPPDVSGITSQCTGIGGCVQAMLAAAIVWVLGLVVSFLGYLIALVFDVLIVFAQYNAFGSARVVQTGWVLIRDIVNMFFIVVILISAFATIVRYQISDFHYSKVLPKLLLMAILINFSRTLTMLLIDVSQVIMLTFVNAFKDAAAGNFINALRIGDMLNFSSNPAAAPIQNGTQAQVGINYGTIITSYLLAVIFCMVALGVILVMVIYLVARIVGLWIALIVSPIAFFATALPEKMKKSVATFTNDYWNKLSSLLVGGPVIAFFLWLTLSTVQASNAQGGLGEGLFRTETLPSGVQFLAGLGNSQSVASFLVGIAMLLMGLTSAVKFASDVGVKGIAEDIEKYTRGAAKWVAKSPYTLSKKSVTGGYNALDRRLNVTGALSKGAMAVTDYAGHVIPGLRGAARPYLQKGITRVEKMRREERKKMGEGMEYMTDAERAYVADSHRRGLLKTKAQKDAAGDFAARSVTPEARRQQTTELTQKYQRELEKQGVARPEAKQRALSRAQAEVEQKSHKDMDLANRMYASSQNAAELNKLEDMVKQAPILESDHKALVTQLKGMSPDDLKKLSGEHASSGRFMSALMEAQGVLKVTEKNDANGKTVRSAKLNEDVFHDKSSQWQGTQIGKSLDIMGSHVRNSTKGGSEITMGQLADSMVQDRRGRDAKIYDTQGELNMSEPYKTYSAGLTGDLSPDNLVKGALDIGMSPGEMQSIVNDTDNDATKTDFAVNVSSAISSDLGLLQRHQGADLNMATRADVDKDLRFFDAVAQRISDLSQSTRTQMYSRMAGSGNAQLLVNAMNKNLLSESKMRGLEAMIKNLSLSVQQITNKMRDPAYNPNSTEEKVMQLFREFQEAMPERSESHVEAATGKTVIDKPGAPDAYKPYLFPGKKA